MTIHKFPLKIIDEQTLKIQGYNKFLSVIEQNEALVVYAFVNTNSISWNHIRIKIVGTGHAINGEIQFNWNFLGTILMKNGSLWHIFYKESDT